jgi:hypothetical protein
VEDIAKEKRISIQDVLLEQLTTMGGVKGVRKALAIGGDDRSIDSILRANNIKAGKNLPSAISLINRVLAKNSEDTASNEEFLRLAAKKQLAVVGITGEKVVNL